jgi:uncharacterized protein YnzC (UPF0291/DUF896 family)
MNEIDDINMREEEEEEEDIVTVSCLTEFECKHRVNRQLYYLDHRASSMKRTTMAIKNIDENCNRDVPDQMRRHNQNYDCVIDQHI